MEEEVCHTKMYIIILFKAVVQAVIFFLMSQSVLFKTFLLYMVDDGVQYFDIGMRLTGHDVVVTDRSIGTGVLAAAVIYIYDRPWMPVPVLYEVFVGHLYGLNVVASAFTAVGLYRWVYHLREEVTPAVMTVAVVWVLPFTLAPYVSYAVPGHDPWTVFCAYALLWSCAVHGSLPTPHPMALAAAVWTCYLLSVRDHGWLPVPTFVAAVLRPEGVIFGVLAGVYCIYRHKWPVAAGTALLGYVTTPAWYVLSDVDPVRSYGTMTFRSGGIFGTGLYSDTAFGFSDTGFAAGVSFYVLGRVSYLVVYMTVTYLLLTDRLGVRRSSDFWPLWAHGFVMLFNVQNTLLFIYFVFGMDPYFATGLCGAVAAVFGRDRDPDYRPGGGERW